MTAVALPLPGATTLACPVCGGTLTLKSSRYGPFYGCSGYPRCDVTVGAHPDGAPLGTPATATMKAARIRAHAAFDQLWKPLLGTMSKQRARGRAYRFLQRALDLPEGKCHIGMFDEAMCDRVVEVCRAELSRRHALATDGRAS